MSKVRKRTWTTRSGESREAWVVDYSDGEGQRHIRTFQRKKDADAHLLTVGGEVRDGTHIAPSKSETVAHAAQRWLKGVEAEGREATTSRQYEQHVRLHIAPRIGSVKLGNLTYRTVEVFRDNLLKDISRQTAVKVFVSFKSILRTVRRAHVAEGISISPGKRPKLEAGKDFPFPKEIGRLLRAADNFSLRQRALIGVAVYTGLRASELRGLRWMDTDLRHGNVHVRQRADRYLQIGVPKTNAGTRTVPIDADLVKVLREWKVACPNSKDTDLVFPAARGGIQHHINMTRDVNPVIIAAGLVDDKGRPKYSLHAFRHFYASWLINRKIDGGREMPVKVVQEHLGHASIVMTLDRYGHLFPRGDDRVALADAASALRGA
jgi:integrase